MTKSCNFHNLSSRTPGSRQASPAEEHLPRLHGLEQGINVNVSGFSQPMMQHMMNNHDQQQMGSSFHPQHQHQHQQHHQHPLGHHVMNGGMPVQVRISQLVIYYDPISHKKGFLIHNLNVFFSPPVHSASLESDGESRAKPHRFARQHATTASQLRGERRLFLLLLLQSPLSSVRSGTSTNRLRLISLQPNNSPPPPTVVVDGVVCLWSLHTPKGGNTRKSYFSDRNDNAFPTFPLAPHTSILGAFGWAARRKKLIVITGIYVVRHLHSHSAETSRKP